MSSKSNSVNQIISLPKGGGALSGIGEKFSADLFTGTGNFTIPIAIPPGRNGFQPQLSLAYSTGNGNGLFGLGWQLGAPGITRKTSKGIPRYRDNSLLIEDWDTFILSGSEDLVPVALWRYKEDGSENNNSNSNTETLSPYSKTKKLEKIENPTAEDYSTAPVVQFRPRTEGLFAQIYHHRNNGRSSGGEDYWEVRSKDGLVSLYGTPKPSSLVEDWQDPAVIADASSSARSINRRKKIFAWNLTRTVDPFGNRIEYLYEKDNLNTDGRGHNWDNVRLSEIRYVEYDDDGDSDEEATNLKFLVHVKFFYEERPDKFSDYRAGFEIRTVKRCRRIEISTHADVDMRTKTFHFVYVDQLGLRAEKMPHNSVSLLARLIVEGHNNPALAEGQDYDPKAEQMPPLEFNYARFEPEKRKFVALAGSDLPPSSLADPSYELLDLTGNGLPDILEMNGTVRYWRNLGNGKFDIPQDMRGAPAGIGLEDPGVQLIDANGDGRPDLLVTSTVGNGGANGLSGYFPIKFGGSWDRRSFQKYDVAPSFNLKDPEVKLVDLTGDGVTDAIRSGSALECFLNDGKSGGGWKETRWVQRKALDKFPNINFSDPRVKWADITGDGLTDIVLIHDGRIEYWPSLGYGDWSSRITMQNSPRFAYGYDPKRILVGDVDGDGLADLVYVDDIKVTLWINQSGNSWSNPIEIRGTPRVTNVDSIRLADIFGSGISGVLWSYDANGLATHNSNMKSNMYFLDFAGGIKPYLLNKMDNNIGATTYVHYAPSTKFYLEDQKLHKTRWKTPLPFPVQVVWRVEAVDYFSRRKLTTEYRYHHGYWDGVEREFRGFGRVDQRDTEEFDDFNNDNAYELHPQSSFDKIAKEDKKLFFSPPTETRTWFHQGPIEGEEFGDWKGSDYFVQEFWKGDPQVLSVVSNHEGYLLTSLNQLGTVVSHKVRRDAMRTLRGRMVRTELYALDGTELQYYPYTVTEYLHDVSPLLVGTSWTDLDQNHYRQSSNNDDLQMMIKHQLDKWVNQIFFPIIVAERVTQWERGNDPMTHFKFTGGYDEYGQPTSHINIAVPRGRDYRLQQAGLTEKEPYLSTHAITTFARRDDGTKYFVNRTASSTLYQIKNDGATDIFSLKEEIEKGPENLGAIVKERPVIGQSINFYDGDAFVGLPFGQLGSYGALVRTESLILTDKILQEAYKSGDVVLPKAEMPPYMIHGENGSANNLPIQWTAEYPQEFRDRLFLPLAGYFYRSNAIDSGYETGYFAATEKRSYDFQEESRGLKGSKRGLVKARLDPLGHSTTILYDKYDLLPTSINDPIGLITDVKYDYRVLQPKLVTDPNLNRTLYAYSQLGFLKSIAVMGKEGQEEGDVPDHPSTIYRYDFQTFVKGMQQEKDNNILLQPIFVHTFKRQDHYWDVIHNEKEKRIKEGRPELTQIEINGMFPNEEVEKFPGRFIQSRQYSDGFGRVLQTRTQGETITFGDPIFGNSVLPAEQTKKDETVREVVGRKLKVGGVDPLNVVVSGWQVYDNKGHVVLKYEPFFCTDWKYQELAEEHLQDSLKVIMYYDPRGYVIRTVNPDGSEQRVVHGVPGMILAPDLTNPEVFEPTPWESYTYDGNDSGGHTHKKESEQYQTHWNTPSSTEVDALGRTVKSIVRNGPNNITDWFIGISTFDIQGNLLTVNDALNRVAFTYVYNLANRLLRTKNIDSGVKRIVFDAAGNELEKRDSKGAMVLHAYDALSRRIKMWARDDDDNNRQPYGITTLREQIEYGDGSANNQPTEVREANKILNLLGKIQKHYDEAGLVNFIPDPNVPRSKPYDFKGNVSEKVRQVIKDDQILAVFKQIAGKHSVNGLVKPFRVAWKPSSSGLLDETQYRTSIKYDALNRIKTMQFPKDVEAKRKVLQLRYNNAGALESVELDGNVYVKYIAYSAKGQRTLVVYGNKVMTRYAYDEKTLRLKRMRSEKYEENTITHSSSQLIYRPLGDSRSQGFLFQDFTYKYDLVGNILKISDRTPKSGISNSPGGMDVLDRVFSYDPVYRLLSATGRECSYDLLSELSPPWADNKPKCIDPTLTRAYTQEYRYDSVGNLKSLKHYIAENGAERGYTRDFIPAQDDGSQKTNHLGMLSVRDGMTYSYAYDKSGNMIQEGSLRHFEWDHSDHLRAFYTRSGDSQAASDYTHYLYDSSGQRVKKLVGGMSNGLYEVTVYIDGLFEYHRLVRPSNTVENNTLHIMDNQSRIALVRVGEAFPDDGAPEKKVKYLLADHLGSSNVVLDETGYVINREEYYPFGETSFGSFARKRYRFTGKERDEQSGFYYHGARYYAPWFCRWISCDPAGLLDGSNVYIYVSNNPIRKSDPTGNQGIDTQELMMGMMWDRMGQEFSAMIESVIGGRAYVSPSQNRVEYSGPQGGLGGAFGGVTRTMSLRTIPVERNPTEVSLMGMEVGASLVPVLDPAERLVAGTTVTGQKTSRAWAAAQLALDVLPFALEARALRTEARAMALASEGSNASVSLAFKPSMPAGHNMVGVNTGAGDVWSHLVVENEKGIGRLIISGEAKVIPAGRPGPQYVVIKVPVSQAEATSASVVAQSNIERSSVGNYFIGCKDCSTYGASVLNAAGVKTPPVTTPSLNAAATYLQSPAAVGPLRAGAATAAFSAGGAHVTQLEEHLEMSIPSEHR